MSLAARLEVTRWGGQCGCRVMVRDLATGMEAPVTELSPRYPELAAKGQVVVSGIPPTDLRVALLRRDYLRAVQPHSHYKRSVPHLPLNLQQNGRRKTLGSDLHRGQEFNRAGISEI